MKEIFVSLVLGLVICASASSAFAQEQRTASTAGQAEESLFQVIARWANFAALCGGLAYLLRKPIGEFFRTRREDIVRGLQRAQDAQTGAQARMEEIEQRLAHLEADVAAL